MAGLILDRLWSPTALVSAAYKRAGIPQPLLRDRRTMRVSPRAIGAGIEAASIGARTGIFRRRMDDPGLDVDLTGCYVVANALGGVQDFLTHEVVAHHLQVRRSLAELTTIVERAVAMGLLDHPKIWRSLAFLVKVRPSRDVLTVHVDLFGTEATVTAPIAAGSKDFWTTGFDLATAVIEDIDGGGAGRVPEIVDAWTFTLGPRLRGLRPVNLLRGVDRMTSGPWTWDPRRDASYRSRAGRTWGHLGLLLAAMREVARTDATLTPAQRIRRRGMLKIASLAAVFGMFAASTPRSDAKPETPHRIVTADGIITVTAGTPERAGPYAFPPAAALVEGAGRLMLTLLMHEVRVRDGETPQIDTDGGFIIATPVGGPLDPEGLR